MDAAWSEGGTGDECHVADTFGIPTFQVVNVAGNGDEDEESKDALVAVEEGIGKDPDATRTITLSCGRLTTGVA